MARSQSRGREHRPYLLFRSQAGLLHQHALDDEAFPVSQGGAGGEGDDPLIRLWSQRAFPSGKGQGGGHIILFTVRGEIHDIGGAVVRCCISGEDLILILPLGVMM